VYAIITLLMWLLIDPILIALATGEFLLKFTLINKFYSFL